MLDRCHYIFICSAFCAISLYYFLQPIFPHAVCLNWIWGCTIDSEYPSTMGIGGSLMDYLDILKAIWRNLYTEMKEKCTPYFWWEMQGDFSLKPTTAAEILSNLPCLQCSGLKSSHLEWWLVMLTSLDAVLWLLNVWKSVPQMNSV